MGWLASTIVVGLVLGTPASLAAQQQASIRLSALGSGTTGASLKNAGQPLFDPNAGVAWHQPTRFGVFHAELLGTTRNRQPHVGRASAGVRELRAGGATWTIEAGDTYLPGATDFGFSNLSAPALTLSGAVAAGRTARSSVSLAAGRVTTWRNLFGTDAHTLGQFLAQIRGSHQVGSRLDLFARASRVRSGELGPFDHPVAASDQAGGGGRLLITPAIHVVGDASLVSYRRVGGEAARRDASGLIGSSILLPRGWIQVNTSRFSPGDFPVLHNPQSDRAGLFAAADYDVLRRLRLFGGLEIFETNLSPGTAPAARQLPRTEGSRGFAGARVQVAPRSTVTLRVEEGARRLRPYASTRFAESDTGAWTVAWHATLGRATTFARYASRQNVDRMRGPGSYDQEDASGQIYVQLGAGAQVFGLASVSRLEAPNGSHTYWQAGGGGQLRFVRDDLYLRGEGTLSRTIELASDLFVPREALSIGLNGQLAPRTQLGLSLQVERSSTALTGRAWNTRSTVRLVQTFFTGAAHPARLTAGGAGRAAGTGTISGQVFADWNGNGLWDPEEEILEAIPVRVQSVGVIRSGRDGRFSFAGVPSGVQLVSLETAALPVDFDPPAVTDVQVEISRGAERQVSFGLIPLGSVHGRVVRDVNGNGVVDDADEPVEGAVLILDGGLRSERARAGRFRFDAVRSGVHTVELLLESLAEGAVIAGAAEQPAEITGETPDVELTFLVSLQQRPEIRRVFPPGPGASAQPPDPGRQRP